MFLISIQLMLGVIVWVIPEEGISLWGEATLSFSKPKDFYKDKLRELEVLREVSSQYSLEELEVDSLLAVNVDSLLLNSAIVLEAKERILHPSDFENGLYSFYHKLSKVNDLSEP